MHKHELYPGGDISSLVGVIHRSGRVSSIANFGNFTKIYNSVFHRSGKMYYEITPSDIVSDGKKGPWSFFTSFDRSDRLSPRKKIIIEQRKIFPLFIFHYS